MSSDYAFYPDAVRIPRKTGSHMKVEFDEEGRAVQIKRDRRTGKLYRYPVHAGKVPEEKCPQCRGLGVLRKESEIIVNIPVGISDGEVIRLAGAGEAVASGAPGDLYAKIYVKKHSLFHKEGSNLVTDLKIKLTTALLGGEYNLKTLDGDIVIKVPTGVSFGEVLRVRGKGVPFSRGGKRGDLLIRVKIELPAHLSKDAAELVEKLKEKGI